MREWLKRRQFIKLNALFHKALDPFVSNGGHCWSAIKASVHKGVAIVVLEIQYP